MPNTRYLAKSKTTSATPTRPPSPLPEPEEVDDPSPLMTLVSNYLQAYSTLSDLSLAPYLAANFTYYTQPSTLQTPPAHTSNIPPAPTSNIPPNHPTLTIPPRDKSAHLTHQRVLFRAFNSLALHAHAMHDNELDRTVTAYVDVEVDRKDIGPWRGECVMRFRVDGEGELIEEVVEEVDVEGLMELWGRIEGWRVERGCEKGAGGVGGVGVSKLFEG